MYVTPEQLIEGELIEREQAAGIYQSIVSRQRDPAILEKIGDNLFRMRVFPVPARDTKRILLDYTVPLEVIHGACRFQLPLLSDLKPIWDFRVGGTIRGPVRPESVQSASHPKLAFQPRPDGAVTFELRENNYQPSRDFSLSFAQPADAAPTLRTYAAEALPQEAGNVGNQDEFSRSRATYFLVSIPPEPPAAAPPADVLVLADTSSSMRGVRLLRRAVRAIVSHLRPEDRLRLACADVAVRPLHEGWLEPGSRSAEEALARFDREFCLGGTELEECLVKAAESFDPKSPRRRLLLYVGDGESSEAAPREEASRTHEKLAPPLAKARISLAGVLVRPSAQGREHWRSLAERSGGLTFDLAGQAAGPRDFSAWLLAGLPSPAKVLEVKAEGVAPADLYCPPAVLPGQTLYILGRSKPQSHVR